MASDDKDDDGKDELMAVLLSQEASRVLATWAAACFGYDEVTPEAVREILQAVDEIPVTRAAALATQAMIALDTEQATDAEKFFTVALLCQQLRAVAARKKP